MDFKYFSKIKFLNLETFLNSYEQDSKAAVSERNWEVSWGKADLQPFRGFDELAGHLEAW